MTNIILFYYNFYGFTIVVIIRISMSFLNSYLPRLYLPRLFRVLLIVRDNILLYSLSFNIYNILSYYLIVG